MANAVNKEDHIDVKITMFLIRQDYMQISNSL